MECLSKVVKTLELRTSLHNFNQLATTNMGLICQVLFLITEQDLHDKLYRWWINDYEKINYNEVVKENNESNTQWKKLIRDYWSIDGQPKDLHYGLLFKLHKKGLSRSRLIELEYLKNPIVDEALKDYDWGLLRKIFLRKS